MAISYDVLTATVVATMAGNELAVAVFFHPQLRTLDMRTHARAASRMASVLGKVMPVWYAVAMVLLVGAAYEHRPVSHGSGLLIGCAAGLWAAIILLTITVLVPINNRIAGMDPEEPYAAWLLDRRRWDALHRVRVAVLLLCVVLLLAGVIGR